MKTFKLKMAANNVLFATLLALFASVIAWVPLRSLLLFDENNYLFQKKTWYNLVQILESFSSRRRVDKRFRVVTARTSGSWDNVQSGLAIVLEYSYYNIKNALKCHSVHACLLASIKLANVNHRAYSCGWVNPNRKRQTPNSCWRNR